jgi:hypothetical protein
MADVATVEFGRLSAILFLHSKLQINFNEMCVHSFILTGALASLSVDSSFCISTIFASKQLRLGSNSEAQATSAKKFPHSS